MEQESNAYTCKPLYDKFFHFANDKSRLKAILNDQKLRRENLVNKLRKLGEISPSVKNDSKLTKSTEHSNVSKKPNIFEQYLMFPQSTLAIPQPSEDWIIVAVPVGIRCLVISKRGSTKVYNDLGNCIKLTFTRLPGGGITDKNGSCIIDCIYCENSNNFFILDILMWNKQTFVNCIAADRFSFVSFKISDIDCDQSQLGCRAIDHLVNSKKIATFSDLPRTYASYELIQKHNFWANPFQINSYLFYHSKSYYLLGESCPTFLWLACNMFESALSSLTSLSMPLCADNNELQSFLKKGMDID